MTNAAIAELLDNALVERDEQRWKTIAFVNRHEIAEALRSTPEVVDGNQVVRASAQEGTALSSQATEPQASPPCGLQSTDAALIEHITHLIYAIDHGYFGDSAGFRESAFILPLRAYAKPGFEPISGAKS